MEGRRVSKGHSTSILGESSRETCSELPASGDGDAAVYVGPEIMGVSARGAYVSRNAGPKFLARG